MISPKKLIPYVSSFNLLIGLFLVFTIIARGSDGGLLLLAILNFAAFVSGLIFLRFCRPSSLPPK